MEVQTLNSKKIKAKLVETKIWKEMIPTKQIRLNGLISNPKFEIRIPIFNIVQAYMKIFKITRMKILALKLQA